jgi:site-specific DNA-methyltransferase (adenine-specific)
VPTKRKRGQVKLGTLEKLLDPFCGCGTAIATAQMLGRKWIGIDITHLSIALQKYRLEAIGMGVE